MLRFSLALAVAGSSFIVSKTQAYLPHLVFGFAGWAIGWGLLSTIKPTTAIGKIAGIQVFTAAFAGQTMTTGLIAILARAPREHMAVIAGTRSMVRLVGGAVALSFSAAVM